jgi:hypothetical protein
LKGNLEFVKFIKLNNLTSYNSTEKVALYKDKNDNTFYVGSINDKLIPYDNYIYQYSYKMIDETVFNEKTKTFTNRRCCLVYRDDVVIYETYISDDSVFKSGEDILDIIHNNIFGDFGYIDINETISNTRVNILFKTLDTKRELLNANVVPNKVFQSSIIFPEYKVIAYENSDISNRSINYSIDILESLKTKKIFIYDGGVDLHGIYN